MPERMVHVAIIVEVTGFLRVLFTCQIEIVSQKFVERLRKIFGRSVTEGLFAEES